MGGKNRVILLLGLALLALVTVLSVRATRADPLFFLPAPQPEQVQVIVLPSAAGLSIHLSLLTADGQPTRCDGQVELVVSEGQNVLYRESRRVRAADFAPIRLGGPQGWHWPLVYSFGLLSYGDRLAPPTGSNGQVAVTFVAPGGLVLRSTAAGSLK
jgi:hypothetical protein